MVKTVCLIHVLYIFDSSAAGTPVSLHPPDSPEITQIIPTSLTSETTPHSEITSPTISSQDTNTIVQSPNRGSLPAEHAASITNTQATVAAQRQNVSKIANQLLSKTQDIRPSLPKTVPVSDIPNIIALSNNIRGTNSGQSLVMLQINKSGGAVLVPANQLVTAQASGMSPVKLASATLSAAAAVAAQAQQQINRQSAAAAVMLAAQPTAVVDPNLVSNTVIPVSAAGAGAASSSTAGGENSAAALLQAKLVSSYLNISCQESGYPCAGDCMLGSCGVQGLNRTCVG